MERETPTRVGDALPTFLAAARGMSFKRVTVGQGRTHRTLHTTTTAAAATPLAVNETEQWRGARGVGRRGGKTPFSFSTPMHPFSLSLARSFRSLAFSSFLAFLNRGTVGTCVSARGNRTHRVHWYSVPSRIGATLSLPDSASNPNSLSLSLFLPSVPSLRSEDRRPREKREREVKLKRRRARRRWRRRRVSDD